MATTITPHNHGYSALKFYSIQSKEMDGLTLSTPLMKFIKKTYGEASGKEYDTVVASIQQRRDSLKNLQEKSEASRDLCLRYALDLGYIEKHFPVNTAGTERIKLYFTWRDAFSKKKVYQDNIYYEQASVLLQAVIYTNQLASSQSRTSTDSIIQCNKLFKQCAQLLQYIQSSVTPKVALTMTRDLTQESLECLRDLMLAEGQQCVCENAAMKGMAFNIQAQLVEACAQMFGAVHRQITGSIVLSGEQFDSRWRGYVQFKALYFAALAQFLQALHLHEKDIVGEEISRLQQALSLVKRSLSEPSKLGSTLPENARQLEEAVLQQLAEARHDNDKVFHETVPVFTTLAPIAAKVLSKLPEEDVPSMLKELDRGDQFHKLYPVRVMEALDKFKVQLKGKFDGVRSNVRQHRDHMKQMLHKRNLPTALVMFEQSLNNSTADVSASSQQQQQQQQHGGYPADIHQKIHLVQTQGGAVHRIRELKLALDEMANHTRELLQQVDGTLVDEERDDAECRNQYGQRWNRMPSGQLNVQLRKQVQDYVNKLQLAQKSDALVASKIDENENKWHRFDMQPAELDALLPQPSAEDELLEQQSNRNLLDRSPELKEAFETLRKYMQELETLFAHESSLEQELSNKVENPGSGSAGAEQKPFEQRLIEFQDAMDGVVNEELENYDHQFMELQQMNALADSTMQQIDMWNQRFTQLLQQSQSNQSQKQATMKQQREAAISEMYAALNSFNTVLANMQEGLLFYTSMQDLAKRMQQRVSDFVFARRTEKADMIANLQQALSGVQISQQQPQQMPPHPHPQSHSQGRAVVPPPVPPQLHQQQQQQQQQQPQQQRPPQYHPHPQYQQQQQQQPYYQQQPQGYANQYAQQPPPQPPTYRSKK